MNGSEPRLLEQTLRIEARPETVWRFWTDPDRMREWWGVAAELDPRPGGMCRVDMGDQYPVARGKFVELEPYERLVFTFGWEPHESAPDLEPGSTRVEVTLAPDHGATILTLRHSGLPTAESVDRHGEGWAHYLPRLAAAAAGAPTT